MPYTKDMTMAQLLALARPVTTSNGSIIIGAGGGGGGGVLTGAQLSQLQPQQQQQQNNVNPNEVFRSMKVGNNSKTPYSDATQVRTLKVIQKICETT